MCGKKWAPCVICCLCQSLCCVGVRSPGDMSGSRSVTRGDQKVEPVSTSDVLGAHHSWTTGGLTENVQETFPLQCWIWCELSLTVSFLITNESVMPTTALHQWWCSVQRCSHVLYDLTDLGPFSFSDFIHHFVISTAMNTFWHPNLPI